MKTRETTPGRTYSVHTASGCTVSDKNGWSKAIDAPDGYFTAHAGEVTIDGDDAADVREVFKLAPQQRLALLGVLGGGAPAWLAPLNAELTALLDGDSKRYNLRYSATDATVSVELAYPDIDGTAKTSVESVLAASVPSDVSGSCGYGVTPYVVSYLVNEYGWASNGLSGIFPKANYPKGFALPKSMPLPTELANRNDWSGIFANTNVTQVPDSFTFDTCTVAGGIYGIGSFENCPLLKRLPETVTLRSVYNAGQVAYGTKLEKLPDALRLDNVTEFRRSLSSCTGDTMPPNVTLHKAKVLYQAFSGMKFRTLPANCHLYALTDASGVFDAALFDKETALRIFDDIPVTNSTDRRIGIGIHVDHENDADILAAIDNATTNKNWIVNVRYNGTRTSAASTMAWGKLIYARVCEEDGEQRLEWYHYVTRPEEYETFRSVASAYDYFGIPMPEDESQTTE